MIVRSSPFGDYAKKAVFVYRLEVSALEAMSVVHEPRIWAAKERVGESEQAATTED
jgi:hypothetical protein